MKMTPRSRRRMIATLATAPILVGLAACGGGNGEEGGTAVMNMHCFAGAFPPFFEEVVFPKFQEEHDVTFNYTAGVTAPAITRMRAEQADPKTDIVCLNPGGIYQAKNLELIAENDPEIVTNLDGVREAAIEADNTGIYWAMQALGITYDVGAFEEAGLELPTSWNDLLDDQHAGKVAFSDFAGSYGPYTMVMLAYANGGSVEDMEPGFEAIAKLAENAVTITGPDMTQLFVQEEIRIAPWADTITANAVKEGLDLKFLYPEEGAPGMPVGMAAVKDGPNAELAQEFLNFMLSDEVQVAVAEELLNGPVVDGLEIEPDLADSVGYSEEAASRLIRLDYDFISEHLSEWNERWLEAVGQ